MTPSGISISYPIPKGRGNFWGRIRFQSLHPNTFPLKGTQGGICLSQIAYFTAKIDDFDMIRESPY
jgi:hypothetical protein